MNAKKLIAAVAVFAAGSCAFAQQTEHVQPDAGFVSTKTRAQVIAELEQAKADGSYALAHQEYDGQFPALSAQAAKYAGNAKDAGKAKAGNSAGN